MSDYVGIPVTTHTGRKIHMAYDGNSDKTLCGRRLRVQAKHFNLSAVSVDCERCQAQIAIIEKCAELAPWDEVFRVSIPSNWNITPR